MSPNLPVDVIPDDAVVVDVDSITSDPPPPAGLPAVLVSGGLATVDALGDVIQI